MGVIERIVAPLGRRIDESSPMVDARLKDGSRVNAIIPPLALKGPTLTIRKFARQRLEAEHLIGYGSLSAAMATFLKVCVEQRKNIVVSGGTGSGKTTFLNVLSNFIPDGERIVTIEDAAELKLNQPHLVVARSASVQRRRTRRRSRIRDLVRNALRMRPDRIVVGECRGGEALDMLQAMNTGHEGSLTTLHANTPRDALSRLETLVLMAGMDLPLRGDPRADRLGGRHHRAADALCVWLAQDHQHHRGHRHGERPPADAGNFPLPSTAATAQTAKCRARLSAATRADVL